jgi:hypothetical protein
MPLGRMKMGIEDRDWYTNKPRRSPPGGMDLWWILLILGILAAVMFL